MSRFNFKVTTLMLALVLVPYCMAAESTPQPDIRLPEAVKSGNTLEVKKLLRACRCR